jgi:hypothetical protein
MEHCDLIEKEVDFEYDTIQLDQKIGFKLKSCNGYIPESKCFKNFQICPILNKLNGRI